MAASEDRITVVVATPLEAALVQRLREAVPQAEVVFEPALLPPTRYRGDHRGVDGFRRSPADQQRWEACLARAEVLLGIPGDTPEGLAGAVRELPSLRWVQATAAGVGEQVSAAQLTPDELGQVAMTSASGVHAGPLAEWALFGLLAVVKDLPRLLADKRDRAWPHHPVGELRDMTLAVVGLGAIGGEVARLGTALGMRVVAVTRRGDDGEHPALAAVHPPERLHETLAGADAMVVTLPLTDATRGMIDGAALDALRTGAIVVNVGRGGVLDETALVERLRDGRLAGAALDVFATEPLPAGSPLWELDNVLLSPHTAALSPRENERIVDLFADNLRRYLDGRPLRNRIVPEHPY